MASHDDVNLTWMQSIFNDKPVTKVASWLQTLQGEELTTLDDLRSLTDDDWSGLSLPLAVRKRLQAAAAKEPAKDPSPEVVDDRKLTQIECIVMDVSSSMKAKSAIDRDKTREDVSKILFLTLVDKLIGLEMPHAVGLIAFGKTVVPIGDFTRDFSGFQDQLGRLDANQGATKLYDAILDAANMIDNYASQHQSEMADNCAKRIFVLTDGEDNSSTTAAWELAHSLQKRSFVLDAIPVAGPNKTLQAVSVASRGLALSVASEAQAMELFENEALLAVCRREEVEDPPMIKCAADLRSLWSEGQAEQKEEIKVAIPSQAKGKTVSGGEAVKKIEEAIKSKPEGNSASLKRIMKELKDVCFLLFLFFVFCFCFCICICFCFCFCFCFYFYFSLGFPFPLFSCIIFVCFFNPLFCSSKVILQVTAAPVSQKMTPTTGTQLFWALMAQITKEACSSSISNSPRITPSNLLRCDLPPRCST